MTKKLLAIGGAYLDINCPDFPFDATGIKPEKELVSPNYVLEPGGSAVNFARLCVALGLETTFIGKVGDDYHGHLLMALLEAAGVKAPLIQDAAVSTNLGINFINPAGSTIMTAVGSANQALHAAELTEYVMPLLPQLDYFYIGGCFKLTTLLPAFTELAQAAKTAGVKIVLDHARIVQNTTKKQLETVKQLALLADYYLPSRDEFLELWEVESVEAGLRVLQNRASAEIILKDGAKGAVFLEGDAIIRSAAFPAQPLHLVGAGDSFNAGLITAQTQGLDLAESVRFANATAALKISHPDLPTFQQVQALIANT